MSLFSSSQVAESRSPRRHLGQQESRSTSLPFSFASLLALAPAHPLGPSWQGTSEKHQAKHHLVDPPLPASESKAPVPDLTRADTPHMYPGPRHPYLEDTHRLQCVRQKHPAGSLLIHTCTPHIPTPAHTPPSLPKPELSRCAQEGKEVDSPGRE